MVYNLHIMQRPTSIRDISLRLVALLSGAGLAQDKPLTHLPLLVNDFRHDLTLNGFSVERINEAPVPAGDPVVDAWLAGLAEYLARKHGLPPPAWTDEAGYFLHEPVFFGGSNFREIALVETPSAWRRRLVFSGATTF